MSHWVTKKSEVLKNVSIPTLQKALEDMDLKLDQSQKSIRNSYGQDQVDAAIVKQGKPASLGFKFTENNGKTEATLTGDFFMTGINEGTFIDQLSQNYQKHNVLDKLSEKSWIVDMMETNENGEIEIEAVKWA